MQGDAEAQMEVGLALFAGQDVGKDELAGCVWLEAAAKGGVAEAQFELGSRHVQGAGSRIQILKDESRILWDAQVLSCCLCDEYLQYHHTPSTSPHCNYATTCWHSITHSCD
jgi:TPR repeat protein